MRKRHGLRIIVGWCQRSSLLQLMERRHECEHHDHHIIHPHMRPWHDMTTFFESPLQVKVYVASQESQPSLLSSSSLINNPTAPNRWKGESCLFARWREFRRLVLCRWWWCFGSVTVSWAQVIKSLCFLSSLEFFIAW